MKYIKKIPETNVHILKHVYATLVSQCPEYINLSFNTFLECRNSIYTIIDNSKYTVLQYKGIIGIRRTYSSNLTNYKDLKYYCVPFGSIYSIEFLHMTDDIDEELGFQLVREAVADKNDAFNIMTHKCTRESPTYKILHRNGFKMDQYNEARDEFVFVRDPILQEKSI